jgi:hypothetical protein
MSASILPFAPRQVESIARLECSKCGAATDAACDCGVAYVPAGVRAKQVIEANPAKSNRALAADIGVDEGTIRRARITGAENSAPEKRKGRDGKIYPSVISKPRRTHEEIEEAHYLKQFFSISVHVASYVESAPDAATLVAAMLRKQDYDLDSVRDALTSVRQLAKLFVGTAKLLKNEADAPVPSVGSKLNGQVRS